MKKRLEKLLSFLLSLAMILSIVPSTALAAGDVKTAVFSHAEYRQNGNYEYDTDWEKSHADTLAPYTTDITFSSAQSTVNLWFCTPDMEARGENGSTVIPYFYEGNAKYVVKEIVVFPGIDGAGGIESASVRIPLEQMSAVPYSTFSNNTNRTGKITIYYLWERTEGTPPSTYTVKYTLNWGDGDGQLPTSVGVYHDSNLNDNRTDEALGLVSNDAVTGGNTTKLLPLGQNNKEVVFKAKDSQYSLIGWKCEDPNCGKTEDHPLHQVGDDFKATAKAAGDDTTIVLSAQWAHTELPTPEEMAQYVDTEDSKTSILTEPVDDEGHGVKITQYTLKDGTPVGGGLLEIDPKSCEVYYEAEVQMRDEVAGALGGYTVWGGEKFAQFQIQVEMDPKLSLVDEDEDGYVEFTFTCPFLRPVKGQEVMVNGEAVEGVQATSVKTPMPLKDDPNKVVEIGPYTYRVPVSALQPDGTILPFALTVEWNPAKGSYSYEELSAPMTLTTARMKTDSKELLETKGAVTGWIDPAASGLAPNMQSNLTNYLLGSYPKLWSYLRDELGLSNQQAAKALENFLADPTTKETSMQHPYFSGKPVLAQVDCVVKFDLNGGTSDAELEYKLLSGKDTPVIADPTRAGYTFAGWSPALTATVTSDVTYVAQWTEVPPSHTHSPGDWGESTATCTASGTEVRRCTECGQVVETRTVAALDHDWGEWETVTEPTTTSEGREHRLCARCDLEESRPLAMLPVPPVTPVIPPVTPPVTPVTPPTVDPGTNIPDEEVPLANVSGLNNIDHFAYIAGYEDGTVRPTNNITRAEVATIFFRLMTEEYRVANWSTSNTFTDAGANAWYNAAISTAAKAGILKGYADGNVKPNANITRAEFAAIAARFISDDVTDDGVGDFSDTANHWAAKEIRLAAKAGWVQGDGGRFRPDDPITRAEVMVLVNRMLDRVPDADHMLPGMKTWSDNPAGTWYYAAVQEATNDHAYERAEDGATEIWTELTEAKDWTALEAEWAANNGASAPKAEAPSENEAA